MFPVLEYAAPRAFYLSAGARMLDAYDERTRQQLLARPEKIQFLRSLDPVTAQLIFGAFSTVNGELHGCLFGTSSSAGAPCAFQTSTGSPQPGSAGTPLDMVGLAFAAGDMDQAEQFLVVAEQQNPSDPRIGYYRRVIERERKSRSGTQESAALPDHRAIVQAAFTVPPAY
jgi:hypothetical protein